MKQIFLFGFLLVAFTNISAQNSDCKVSLTSLKGTYTGDCTNGKAEGKGKAGGIDNYEGDFKNGWPDGKGTYTWKDGHYFIGHFKKGEKNGKGDMFYKNAGGADSVITGFWKKDKYLGKYEEDYVIVSKTSRVTKVTCQLVSTKGDGITITLHRLGGNSNDNSMATIAAISVSQGTYYTKNSQELASTSVTRLQQVTFPFKAIFYLSTDENIEILFNSKADYEVSADLLY